MFHYQGILFILVQSKLTILLFIVLYENISGRYLVSIEIHGEFCYDGKIHPKVFYQLLFGYQLKHTFVHTI